MRKMDVMVTFGWVCRREVFQHFNTTLAELGLPSGPDKQTTPCIVLIYLGIRNDLDTNTLSIHPDKLQNICNECLAV